MKVVTNQTITPYNKDTLIKPEHPTWKLKNIGTQTILINGVFPLVAGLEFGVDAMELITPIIEKAMLSKTGEKIEILNDTQFSISFIGAGIAKALLFQTSFTLMP